MGKNTKIDQYTNFEAAGWFVRFYIIFIVVHFWSPLIYMSLQIKTVTKCVPIEIEVKSWKPPMFEWQYTRVGCYLSIIRVGNCFFSYKIFSLCCSHILQYIFRCVRSGDDGKFKYDKLNRYNRIEMSHLIGTVINSSICFTILSKMLMLGYYIPDKFINKSTFKSFSLR